MFGVSANFASFSSVADISPADIHRELSKHPCFISIGTESARDNRSISETKQYLKDTGFIDENTVVTETTGYLEVLVSVPVNILAIRGSKRLKFTGQHSYASMIA